MNARMAHARTRRHDSAAGPSDGELNLVPIMSMLVILIPVILVAFNFVEIRVESAAAPRMSPPGDSTAPPPKVPTAFIAADSSIVVRGFDGKRHATVDATVGGRVDLEKFSSVMADLQRQKPAASQVRITAAPSVPWHVMARCMDATRGAPDDGTGQGRFRDVVLLAPKTAD